MHPSTDPAHRLPDESYFDLLIAHAIFLGLYTTTEPEEGLYYVIPGGWFVMVTDVIELAREDGVPTGLHMGIL